MCYGCALPFFNILQPPSSAILLHIIHRYSSLAACRFIQVLITMSDPKGKGREEQKDSVVDQSFSNVEQAHFADLKTRISADSDYPADSEAVRPSHLTGRRKSVKAQRAPFLDWDVAPWPREEFGAPITFKIFCAGLKELQASSNIHVRSSPRLRLNNKYWSHVLDDLYRQAKDAARQERSAMDEDLAYFKQLFGSHQTADLSYPLVCTGKRMDRSKFHKALIN
ncbi:hypothetical protein BKA66DRAFT_464809 [Pyrenochaeta sp. MPI-SDFR-AT-0127]|nr:hypothetical protein BKA66DRAFT_464809 [Pyrenochaeta sp. MPI-SDFR-AT-0127]